MRPVRVLRNSGGDGRRVGRPNDRGVAIGGNQVRWPTPTRDGLGAGTPPRRTEGWNLGRTAVRHPFTGGPRLAQREGAGGERAHAAAARGRRWPAEPRLDEWPRRVADRFLDRLRAIGNGQVPRGGGSMAGAWDELGGAGLTAEGPPPASPGHPRRRSPGRRG